MSTDMDVQAQMQAMQERLEALAAENAQLRGGVAHQQALLDNMKQATEDAAKTHGIGAVWRDTTGAVSSVSYGVKVLADAGGQLAEVARGNSVKTNLETSSEICGMLDMELGGLEALDAASTIVEYVCRRR